MPPTAFDPDALQQQQIAEMCEELKALRHLLTGNSTPQKGIAFQVALLNEHLNKYDSLAERMDKLEAAMNGSGSVRGLRQSIQRIEDWQARFSQIMGMFVAPVIVVVMLGELALVWALLTDQIVMAAR